MSRVNGRPQSASGAIRFDFEPILALRQDDRRAAQWGGSAVVGPTRRRSLASRRRRGPVALRPRLSPGVPFSGCSVEGEIRRSTRVVKQGEEETEVSRVAGTRRGPPDRGGGLSAKGIKSPPTCLNSVPQLLQRCFRSCPDSSSQKCQCRNWIPSLPARSSCNGGSSPARRSIVA
jgi:hypothetical protein